MVNKMKKLFVAVIFAIMAYSAGFEARACDSCNAPWSNVSRTFTIQGCVTVVDICFYCYVTEGKILVQICSFTRDTTCGLSPIELESAIAEYIATTYWVTLCGVTPCPATVDLYIYLPLCMGYSGGNPQTWSPCNDGMCERVYRICKDLDHVPPITKWDIISQSPSVEPSCTTDPPQNNDFLPGECYNFESQICTEIP
ncbi:MAG: hypothetical protein HW421_3285 [Ignavibacteria bacterium]|nr:hypothetical protein [Ignavibacteria bacterium]